MDINGDGYIDMFSGDYITFHTETGESYVYGKMGEERPPLSSYANIFVFYGQPDGQLKEKIELRNRTGTPVMSTLYSLPEFHEKNLSYRPDPHLVDWDRDGDLDMLIGLQEGIVVLVKNLGDAKNMAFSEEPVRLKADGEVLRVNRMSSPFMADMDDDGKRDLIVGDYVGDIYFFKNIGRDDDPKLAAAVKIHERPKEASARKIYHRNEPFQQPPGSSARVFVIDYNDDGKMDILQGDYSGRTFYKEGISAEEVAAVHEAIATFNVYDAEVEEKYGDRWRYKIRELPGEEGKKINERWNKLNRLSRENIKRESYGFVWLHLGK